MGGRGRGHNSVHDRRQESGTEKRDRRITEEYILPEKPREEKGAERDIVRNKSGERGTSLVAQWLRILLPMQGTQV